MTFIFGPVKIGNVESGGIVNFGNCACIPSADRSSASGAEEAVPNLTMLSFSPIPPQGTTPLIIPPEETE